MISRQFHYPKLNRFMLFLLAEILNFQSSTHLIGVGNLSNIVIIYQIFTDFLLCTTTVHNSQKAYDGSSSIRCKP